MLRVTLAFAYYKLRTRPEFFISGFFLVALAVYLAFLYFEYRAVDLWLALIFFAVGTSYVGVATSYFMLFVGFGEIVKGTDDLIKYTVMFACVFEFPLAALAIWRCAIGKRS